MTTLLDRDVDKTATYCVVKMATVQSGSVDKMAT